MRVVPHFRKFLTSAAILTSSETAVKSLSTMSIPKYSVRKAEKTDLPHIHGLIKHSFAAMNEYFTDPVMQEMMAKGAQSMCDGELSEEQFEKTYFSSDKNHFWVIEEQGTGGVHGCVGIKRFRPQFTLRQFSCLYHTALSDVLHPNLFIPHRHTADSAELVRMAVDPDVRGQGLGNTLLKEFDTFCRDTGVLQVTLSTANPRAGNFYKKCGFVDLAAPDSKVHRMIKYFGERVLRRVAIVGGTHGNERIGVELVRQWAADKKSVKRSTFETVVVVGNPPSSESNVRYIEADMNRQFSEANINTWETKDSNENSEFLKVAEIADGICPETSHAKKLNELLGPKGATYKTDGCDFIIDLHSSGSNVGLMAMINGADKDCHAVRLSQYLLEDKKGTFPNLKVTNSKLDKKDTCNVDSISPYGIAFEVGPIMHGTLSADLLEQTRQLVFSSLDFIEEQNKRILHAAAAHSTDAANDSGDVGVVKSLGRDIVWASTPATEALIKKVPPFKSIDCFVEVSKEHYPCSNVKGGESAASTYPTSTVLHPSLEGKDWAVIEDGQPAFISTDGSSTVTPFSRPLIPAPHFQPPGQAEEPPLLYPVFINEPAYQKDGIAFAVYKKLSRTVF